MLLSRSASTTNRGSPGISIGCSDLRPPGSPGIFARETGFADGFSGPGVASLKGDAGSLPGEAALDLLPRVDDDLAVLDHEVAAAGVGRDADDRPRGLVLQVQ